MLISLVNSVPTSFYLNCECSAYFLNYKLVRYLPAERGNKNKGCVVCTLFKNYGKIVAQSTSLHSFALHRHRCKVFMYIISSFNPNFNNKAQFVL